MGKLKGITIKVDGDRATYKASNIYGILTIVGKLRQGEEYNAEVLITKKNPRKNKGDTVEEWIKSMEVLMDIPANQWGQYKTREKINKRRREQKQQKAQQEKVEITIQMAKENGWNEEEAIEAMRKHAVKGKRKERWIEQVKKEMGAKEE